jgi:hypothetical protein
MSLFFLRPLVFCIPSYGVLLQPIPPKVAGGGGGCVGGADLDIGLKLDSRWMQDQAFSSWLHVPSNRNVGQINSSPSLKKNLVSSMLIERV